MSEGILLPAVHRDTKALLRRLGRCTDCGVRLTAANRSRRKPSLCHESERRRQHTYDRRWQQAHPEQKRAANQRVRARRKWERLAKVTDGNHSTV